MYIHKYNSDGDTFYRLSEQAKPGKTIILETQNWAARLQVGAKTKNALASIERAFAGKGDEEEAPVETPEKEVPEEATEKKASVCKISDFLRISVK